MATIYDLFEVTSISADTTYSQANGNLLGVVDNVTSSDLNDGEFDRGDFIFIGGKAYRIDRIQEPSSSGRFVMGDGTQKSFDPRDEDNLDAVFLTVSNGSDVRHFIIPNDRYGDMNVEWIRTGSLTDVGGNDAAVISTTNNSTAVVCFVRGTLILGADGREVPVEALSAGEMVMTLDHGLQPVRWIGSSSIGRDRLRAVPQLRPVRIARGALGSGLPVRDLFVSQQHRILIRSRIAERMFEAREVLVAAKHLICLDGIDISEDADAVEYFHILLDNHEVLTADGAACESLYLGDQALSALGRRARREIQAIPRNIRGGASHAEACRPLISGSRGRRLAERHRVNNRSLWHRVSAQQSTETEGRIVLPIPL